MIKTTPQTIRHCGQDERGFVITIELVLMANLLAFGFLVGIVSVRDALVAELSDAAGGIQDISQSLDYSGIVFGSGGTHGSIFTDALDFCDSTEDGINQADNCVTFDASPEQEAGSSGSEPIVISSSFEDGIDPDNANKTWGSSPSQRAFLFDEGDIADWNTTAPDGQIEIWESGFNGVVSQDGNYHAEINANQSAQLFQDIPVNPGDVVEYSIWHRGRSGVDVANVLIGSPGMQSVDQTMTTDNNAWVQYTGTYVVPAGVTTLRIGFEAVSTANGSPSVGNFIDNLQLQISN